jgi:transposase
MWRVRLVLHLPSRLFLVSCHSSAMSKRTHMQYSADTKHNILLQYRPHVRGCGFAALAKKHNVKGGARLVQLWYRGWNRSPESLKKQTTSHKPRILEAVEVKQHIRDYVEEQNQQAEPVGYKEVKEHVDQEIEKEVSMRTIQRYGKRDAMLSYKRTTRKLHIESEYTSHPCMYLF